MIWSNPNGAVPRDAGLIAATNRAESAALADAANLLRNRFVVLGLAARRDHDATPVEGGLDHVRTRSAMSERSRDLRAWSHSICSVRGLTSTFFELVTGELLRSDVVTVDAGSFEDCP
jgi:hypothetical protein